MSNEQELLDDEVARARIVDDLDTTFLVEAGAGSGKTTSIINRMIALIRERKVEVRHIAAITFTNKAADELMSRFRIKLEQEYSRAPIGSGRDVLEEAIRQIPESFIGTIHAFCGRLLRERPIEAGIDPDFREMDELEDQEFRARCWDDYLDELRSRGDDHSIEALFALQVHVEDMRVVYNRVSDYEDVQVYTESVTRPDFDRIRHSLFPLIHDSAAFIPSSEPAKGWDNLQMSIRTAARHLSSRDMHDDGHVLTVAKLFDRNLGVVQNRWTDGKMAKQLHERFRDWQITTLQPFLQNWREYIHPQLIDFVLPAVAYCKRKRMETGRLNFQDLLMEAAKLLRSFPEIRAYFAQRVNRLFVDEFQDTDPIQAEMMLLLTGVDKSESDWRKQLPRPGSLFVVGDPKQSIYRFRRADISTYNFVKRRIAESGAVLQLTRNFRSVKAIGDYVNYAFESKFIRSEEEAMSDCQAPYVRMLTQQPNPRSKGSLHGVYRLEVPKQEWDRQSAIASYDTEQIAQFIAWACAGNMTIREKDGEGRAVSRPASPNDFLILLKYRKFIHLYAEKLEEYGIASDTSGSQLELEELRAVYLLTLALWDPADQVPLLAVLRGMLFGISDDELYHYRRAGSSISLHVDDESDLLLEKVSKVGRALAKLREYMEWFGTMPALAAFIRIVNDIGIVQAAAASGEAGAIRGGTLIKLLEVLQSDTEASVEWTALMDRLRKLSEKDGMEAASFFTGSGDAVRIMNLHKAKGLEAPVVLMACPCGNVDHDVTEHIDRLAEPPLGYFTISKPRDSYTQEIVAQPAGWEERAGKERLFVHAETERLLYVAATRAKQLLIVSQYPTRPAIDPWSHLSISLHHQLELDPISFDPVETEELAEVPDVESALAGWNRKVELCSLPSYQMASVTGIASAKSSVNGVTAERGDLGASEIVDRGGLHRLGATTDFDVVGDSTKGGMAYGNVIHRCLQALGEGMAWDDISDFCRMAGKEEGIDSEEWIERAEKCVAELVRSSIWQRSRNARRAYHEFSFMTFRQSVASETNIELKPLFLRGVIDLVFEEEDGGWVIVDFKTDRFEHGHEPKFLETYKLQLQAYVEEWERTIGGKVKEAGLYFTAINQFVAL